MVPQPSPANDPVFLSRIVEATVRVGVLVVLVAWCLQIVWPFVVPLIWGIIIAIAAHPFTIGFRLRSADAASSLRRFSRFWR